ncbi:MAG: DUF389 domain-containing protein [Pseudomonadota bacterium]
MFDGRPSGPYWTRFCVLLAGSVIIATMGLLRNSGAVVIAAMLIAPLMTPILGIAAAMIMGWRKRVLTLLLRVLIAAACSVLLAWLVVFVANVPRGLMIPSEVVARTDPGIEDLVIALAAGAAGAYVQINREELSLLPGAAIGVALVPPLSAVGILIHYREFDGAYDATLLFMTNLAAIILAACAVYLLAGARKLILKRSKRRTTFTASFVVISGLVAVLILQLGEATVQRYRESRMSQDIAEAVAEWSGPVSVEIMRLHVRERRKIADLWLIVDMPVDAANTSQSFSQMLPAELRNNSLVRRLRPVLGPDYKIAVRFQPRFAGLVELHDIDDVQNAPAVGAIDDDDNQEVLEADKVLSPSSE